MLELRQNLKLTQQLIMTPQLQQAIKLLQLSRLELVDAIRQEIEYNPALEEEYSSAETGPVDGQGGPGDGAGEGGDEPIYPEKTQEISLESDHGPSLSEIDWSDYANEYEPPPFKINDDGDMPSRVNILIKKTNLQSHLQWQLNFSSLTDEEKEIGFFVIGNLNSDGFLEATDEDIVQQTGCTPETAAHVVTLIQDMDPPGVGARNVRECLQLQLERLGITNTLSHTIVKYHLHQLETKNYGAIARALGVSISEVITAVKIIIGLDPHPGRQYSDEDPQYIIPDVYLHKIDNEYVILLNDEGLPRLRVSSYYKDILKNKIGVGDPTTKEYIQDKLKSAVWLIKSIQQRQRTIYRVVESLVKFQRDFFDKGLSCLKPLVLRDVADDLGMHESTISRVTSNKFIHTPQGTFELKYFFNSHLDRKDGGDSIASETIKERIRTLVHQENPERPLSDNIIADLFQKEGIQLARRTVAKYREQIGILPSKCRRRPRL